MSQGRPKASPWREILKEVDAQQGLLDSLLHPDQKFPATHVLAASISPSFLQPRVVSEVTAAADDQPPASQRPTISDGHMLLSPSLEAVGGERGRTIPSFRVVDAVVREEQRGGTDVHHRGVVIRDGGSRAVEALVEALSTSSWSSEGSTASRFSMEGSSGAVNATEALLVPGERDIHYGSSSKDGDHSTDAIATQSRSLHAAAFYFHATQVVASEFEGRQHIMFDEFTAVTELVSLFICHMSWGRARS